MGEDGSKYINHYARTGIGSDNYAQSIVRQVLNSSEASLKWEPMTFFDRPPENGGSSYRGFMHALSGDFLNAVQTTLIPCRTNSVYETDSLDGTQFKTDETYNLKDKFFILSRAEIFGTWDDLNLKDGDMLEYYAGLGNSERIVRDTRGTARDVWIRTPYISDAQGIYVLSSGGSLSNTGSGSHNYYIIPACIIA